MSAKPKVIGRCPGAFRPMMSGDGLVVRVRPRLSQVSADEAAAIADLAEEFGNGAINLTTRANLQIRGVSEERFPALLDRFLDLDLLDDGPEAEARRNIVVTPFRAPASAQDEVAEGLAAELASQSAPSLPAKFGFVIDAEPGERHLAGISGDIRIEGGIDGLIVRAESAARGKRASDGIDAVRLAMEMARWFVESGGIGADGRGRMQRHMGAGAALPEALSGDADPVPAASPARPGRQGDWFAVAAEFGQLPAEGLRALAYLSNHPIRVTPFRMLLVHERDVPDNLAAVPGAITAPDDPLLRVVACTGHPGCPQAQAATIDTARRMAGLVSDDDILHVSGCSKGCAHPARARLTLVGNDGRFDLVEDGHPWDTPVRHGLVPEDLAVAGERL